MAAPNFPDVTLVYADPALLLCWEEQVKQGKDCSLLLDNKNGKITTCLKVTNLRSLEAKIPKLVPSKNPQTVNKKKGDKKKSVQKLLAFHQRLVKEKGLPPSRLMLQHAAAQVSSPVIQPEPDHKPDQEDKVQEFKCEQCDYTSKSMHGLSVHKGHKHKDDQLPENLSDDSLGISFLSEDRTENSTRTPDKPNKKSATSEKIQEPLSQKESEAMLFQERKDNYFRKKLLRQMKANPV